MSPDDPGLTHEEFMALSGLAPLPKVPASTRALPIVFERAVVAIRECVTIDEAKAWNDRAEALAAWARIYGEDRCTVEARRLKLHAYRRMGQLARELAPRIQTQAVGPGRPAGVSNILREQGLTRNNAHAAMAISQIPARKFDAMVAQDRPPTPLTAANYRKHNSEHWVPFQQAMTNTRGLLKRIPADRLVNGLTDEEADTAFVWVDQVMPYLRAMLAALERRKRQHRKAS